MTTINESVVLDLEKNVKSIYIDGVQILIRILNNIIKEPKNAKFRTFRLNKVTEGMLTLKGIKPVLIETGFVEQSDQQFHLPPNVLIASLKKYRDFIVQRLEYIKSSGDVSLKNSISLSAPSPATGAIKKEKPTNVKHVEVLKFTGQTFKEKTSFTKVILTSNSEIQYMELLSDNFMQYEDKDLQEYAKSLIPIERLKCNAIEKMRNVQRAIVKEGKNISEPNYDEIFIIELMNWFHSDFFTWVNEIECKICHKTKIIDEVTAESGIRVEIINCCGTTTKFYRYNDVALLLRTRKGRCGEYANCFTFLCRCFGYDARFVHGNFDHVWTEVYSPIQNRWIHYDPSENIFDAPLVYQHGWKRQVEYVTAFSYDDIQDVTWRYTSDFKMTLNWRKTIPEDELLNCVLMLRRKRQIETSETRKKFLTKRNLFELLTFMEERQPTADENAGRSSGSLDWRLLRGEQSNHLEFKFTANETEVALKQFSLRYSCAKNWYEKFVRDTSEILETYKNWSTCTYLSENIILKKELDWKMTYLARSEESEKAKIVWKFDFSERNLKIKSIRIKFLTKCFENGKIDVMYWRDIDSRAVSQVEDLIDASIFSLEVNLSHGKGMSAWQHTQLFRQEITSVEYPFEIFIEFY